MKRRRRLKKGSFGQPGPSCDEDVSPGSAAAGKLGLKGIDEWKIQRTGLAGQVEIAIGIEGKIQQVISTASTQEGRENQDRIDHQGAIRIVGS